MRRQFIQRFGDRSRSVVQLVVLSTVLSVVLPAIFLTQGCSRFDAGNAPSKILLVSIDTTRADRLSAYGYKRPTTPFLKRFSKLGVRMENAFAVMPTTDPSHASILTGQYPRKHGIMRNAARRLDADAPTLATFLQERGYRTAAITARIGLDPELRHIAGFDDTNAPRAPKKWRSAGEVLRHASEWLDEREGERWFLWVHLWEPHLPYEPAQPYRDKFIKRPTRDYRRYSELDRFLESAEQLKEQEILRARSLYDGEIAASDRAVQRIVQGAYDAAPQGSPLVLIVSDHGESLAERRSSDLIGFGHGVLLFNETVRVPWLTVWEGQLEPSVLETPLSLVDLAPTVMDLVDPGRRYETDGRSVATSLRSREEPEPRAFYLERRLFNSTFREDLRHPETAIVDYPWKLIENEGEDVGELYHLERDPLEEVSLVGSEPKILEALSARLARWRADHPLPRQQGPKTRMAEQGEREQELEREREQEALRALGYID